MLIVDELMELLLEVIIMLVEGLLMLMGEKLHNQLAKMVWYGALCETLLSAVYTYTALRAEIWKHGLENRSLPCTERII